MNQKWYRGGYLFVKQSAKDRKRGLKPWRRKFVAVHQNACTSGVSLLFELYQDEFTYRQVACVLLNDITKVKRCTSRTNRHAFAVLSPRRQLYLAADSETDALEWVAMLKKFMSKKTMKREALPEQEHDNVYNVSILPNEHSERLELHENYRLTINNPHMCLYNSSSEVILQWKFTNLKRFMLTKKCHEKDTDKILHISSNARCKNGECEIIFYCTRGKKLIAKLLEEVSINRETRVSRRRSITSSMIFDITPEDLARLGTISETSSESDEDAIRKDADTKSDQTDKSLKLNNDTAVEKTSNKQRMPLYSKPPPRPPRSPTVGKPVLKKRRAPPPPPPSPTSTDRHGRKLEYSPSCASSTSSSTISTVTSEFDLGAAREDVAIKKSIQSINMPLPVHHGSSPLKSAKGKCGSLDTIASIVKTSPPRPKHPPKRTSPVIHSRYKSVEAISSNKENRNNSPPMLPKSVSSMNCVFDKPGRSPPIPPVRRRKQKQYATLERCTNIHTEMTSKASSKPTLKQIANGKINPLEHQKKASTLNRTRAHTNPTLAAIDNEHVINYNNNSSPDDTASDTDGSTSDDITSGHWHYDIRPYVSIKTKSDIKKEQDDLPLINTKYDNEQFQNNDKESTIDPNGKNDSVVKHQEQLSATLLSEILQTHVVSASNVEQCVCEFEETAQDVGLHDNRCVEEETVHASTFDQDISTIDTLTIVADTH